MRALAQRGHSLFERPSGTWIDESVDEEIMRKHKYLRVSQRQIELFSLKIDFPDVPILVTDDELE